MRVGWLFFLFFLFWKLAQKNGVSVFLIEASDYFFLFIFDCIQAQLSKYKGFICNET